MKRKVKSKTPEYTFLVIKICDYKSSVNAGINHNIMDTRKALSSEPIYNFYSDVEVTGKSTYPEERANCKYTIHISCYDSSSSKLTATLKDHHVIDKERHPKYRKHRGNLYPVYNAPKLLGFIDKLRGLDEWTCHFFVAPQTITDMLILLSTDKQLFIAIHEFKEGRYRQARSISIQTVDPAEE